MNAKVSRSQSGQKLPPPNRQQRDSAYSSGGGRRAPEVDISEDLNRSIRIRDARKIINQAPVGTELETQAHEVDENA